MRKQERDEVIQFNYWSADLKMSILLENIDTGGKEDNREGEKGKEIKNVTFSYAYPLQEWAVFTAWVWEVSLLSSLSFCRSLFSHPHIHTALIYILAFTQTSRKFPVFFFLSHPFVI